MAGVGYSGSHATNLLSGGGQQTTVSYGVDINSYPGDLIQNNKTIPTRLNTSFGAINYTQNDRYSNFNALIISGRARFGARGFITASYTRSASRDDTQVYPTWTNPAQYYGPSVWDAPNRFSLGWNFTVPGLHQGHGFVGRVTGGWSIAGTSIVQSGNPFTVRTTATFLPARNSAGVFTGFAPGSGDFNADGDNNDYPDVQSYAMNRSRQAFLNGVFTSGQFTTPAFGQEGNEKWGQFRGPKFAETDAALLKDTIITERVRLQLRFEFFNVFNYANLSGPSNAYGQAGIDNNLANATFGRATTQALPRWIQLGANLKF